MRKSIAVILVLVFAGIARAQEANANPETLWSQTDFSFKFLREQIFKDELCGASDKTYFGCLDAADTILASIKPGYMLSTADHKLNPAYEVAATVGSFQILKYKGDKFLQKFASPLERLKSERAQQKIDDAIWLAKKPMGFSQLFDKISKMADPKLEKYVAGSAENSYLADVQDPHSYYMPIAVQKEESGGNIHYAGIGAAVSDTPAGITLNQIFDHSPAQASGLQAGDIVIKIDGQLIDRSMSRDEVVRKLLGPAGTTVQVTVLRGANVLTFEIKRAEIKVAKVIGELQDNVGYIQVYDFLGKDNCEKFDKLLTQFKTADGLVIDLRGNGGGLVDEAQCMLSAFVKEGTRLITYMNPYGSDIEGEVDAVNSPVHYSGPIAVLVNQFSASAAELMTGVLQDYNLAYVVGARTYGKGTAQTCQEDASMGQVLKCFTVARFHLPSGRSNQVVGIVPDFEAYYHKTPTPVDLMSFRESEIHRFTIPQGPDIQPPVDRHLPQVKACVQAKSSAIAGNVTDYALQLAKLVVECRHSLGK